jgi:hypothetical protein
LAILKIAPDVYLQSEYSERHQVAGKAKANFIYAIKPMKISKAAHASMYSPDLCELNFPRHPRPSGEDP